MYIYLLTLLHSERPKLYTILVYNFGLSECNRVYSFGLSECNRVKENKNYGFIVVIPSICTVSLVILQNPLSLSNSGTTTNYHIKVKTGDIRFAGTDANVFIQMSGPNGITPKLKLDDAKNNFERNMVDTFDVSIET